MNVLHGIACEMTGYESNLNIDAVTSAEGNDPRVAKQGHGQGYLAKRSCVHVAILVDGKADAYNLHTYPARVWDASF